MRKTKTRPGTTDVLDWMWEQYREEEALDGLRIDNIALPNQGLVLGEGTQRPWVTFIGEGPGQREAIEGRPFVGASGDLLRTMIAESLRKDALADCYITNVVKYRPPQNRTPTPQEVAASLPYLRAELGALRPLARLVVPLGGTAWKLFGSDAPISRSVGQSYMASNMWTVIPMFHPSYVLRGGITNSQYADQFDEIARWLRSA